MLSANFSKFQQIKTFFSFVWIKWSPFLISDWITPGERKLIAWINLKKHEILARTPKDKIFNLAWKSAIFFWYSVSYAIIFQRIVSWEIVHWFFFPHRQCNVLKQCIIYHCWIKVQIINYFCNSYFRLERKGIAIRKSWQLLFILKWVRKYRNVINKVS